MVVKRHSQTTSFGDGTYAENQVLFSLSLSHTLSNIILDTMSPSIVCI